MKGPRFSNRLMTSVDSWEIADGGVPRGSGGCSMQREVSMLIAELVGVGVGDKWKARELIKLIADGLKLIVDRDRWYSEGLKSDLNRRRHCNVCLMFSDKV